MNAFKLACINYKSSSIAMPTGELLSRKQVTLMQQNQLQNLWKAISTQAQD
jgi:hypothetical protein